jgi:dUTPase
MNDIKNIKFLLFGDSEPPQRRKGDAGYDIFVPHLSEQFAKDLIAANPGQPRRWSIVGGGPTNPDEDRDAGFFIQLNPHCDLRIPTYIRSQLPDNVYLRAAPRGSSAVQIRLAVGAEVIDPSFQGNIFLHIYNTSNEPTFIKFGQKLIQLIPELFDPTEAEVFYSNKIERCKDYKNFINEDDFFPEKTERGEGMLDSTSASPE